MTYLQLLQKTSQLNIITKSRLNKLKRDFCKANNLSGPPTDIKLLAELKKFPKQFTTDQYEKLSKLLQTRPMRTLSGVSILTVLTKPWPCPGKCVYCPNETDMPKSYLKSEPAAARAWLTKFNPAKQVKTRLRALSMTGHHSEKIELIILGGTFPSYAKKYQFDFIKKIFNALNNQKQSTSLTQAQTKNETAKHKCVGLTIETRPDFVNLNLIAHWRALGATRIELGVQSLDDKTLKTIQRGHNLTAIKKATRLLKDNGFKVLYHLMPGLPQAKIDQGSLRQRFKADERMLKQLFFNKNYFPDQIKIYPCSVIKQTELYNWYKQGFYKPYTADNLIKLLPKLKKLIPPFVRLERLVRDIPAGDIAAGSQMTNIRQILVNKKTACRCIRCREARNLKLDQANLTLINRKYLTAGGWEYFLSFEDKKLDKIFALLRLRLPIKFNSQTTLASLKDCALIREVHTFGQTTPTKLVKNRAVQHLGLGKQLIAAAEKIAARQNFKKIAVISGVGVRNYYRKLGYELGRDNYMFKK